MAETEIKKASPKNESIQALRGIAFFGIYLGHLITFGWTPVSVAVFFILSGFLLTLKGDPAFEKCNLADSFKGGIKRISKLYPLHIILMIMCIPSEPLLTEGVSPLSMPVKILSNIFLVQSLWPSASFAASLNGVSWFLSTILILYVVFPFFYRLIKKIRTTAVLLLLFIVLLALQTAFVYAVFSHITDGDLNMYLVHCFPPYRFFDLAYGIILGLIVKRGAERERKKYVLPATLWEIAVLAVTGYIVYLWNTENVYIFFSCAPVCPLLAVIWIMIFYRKTGLVSKLLTNKLTVFTGNMSGYAFLIHFVILRYSVIFVNPHLSVLRRTIVYCILLPGYFILTLILSHIYDAVIGHKPIIPEYIMKKITLKNIVLAILVVAAFVCLSKVRLRVGLNFGRFPVNPESGIAFTTVDDIFMHYAMSLSIIFPYVDSLLWIVCAAAGYIMLRSLTGSGIISRIISLVFSAVIMFLPLVLENMIGRTFIMTTVITPIGVAAVFLLIAAAALFIKSRKNIRS